ncbi:MAG: DedA family protein [gamma proteobacterium symbiont of Lucinoma myriamae]|nr:DedA family protein [gamma proteobacterium symbiont of Lucinoma myriamae]MCU7818797.1 DedA family protein [gamma proteobacterium symbiont of Lucinoma myriamae]MCU7831980.1 DedA family protein [gamma proteobacterium symbiont of Lucinoma myriamae]
MTLLTLFFSGFTSATLLPGSSEALFLYMLSEQTYNTSLLILFAGIGNSLGGMTNWLLGLLIRKGVYKKKQKTQESKSYNKAEKLLQNYGAPVLFFSFLPIIGDPLCVVSGFVKISWLKALVFISAGKFFRYFMLTYIVF